MSYILDAIKKAENQRQMDQVPTLESVVAQHGGSKSRVRLSWFIAPLIMVALIGLVIYFHKPILDQYAVASNWVVQKFDELITKENKIDAPVQNQTRSEQASQPSNQQSNQQATQQPTQQLGQQTVQQAAFQPNAADKAAIDRISISVISYSANSHKRFIMDGGQVLREGDRIEGFRILEILQHKVVIEVGGQPYPILIN